MTDPILPFPLTDEKLSPVPSAQPPSYQVVPPGTPPAHAEPDRPSHCRRRCRRFGHFLVATLFIWFTVRYVLRHCELRRFDPSNLDDLDWKEAGLSAIGFGGHSHPHPRPPPPSETIDACVEPDDWTEFDPPSEGLHHHRFDVWRRTEFSLPSTSDDIFLFSRGFRSHRGVNGVLHVVEAADRDDIGVEVIVGSLEKSHLFEKVKLCKLHRGDNGHGVGILAPWGRRDRPHHRHPHHRDVLFFNITVSLPEGKDVTAIPRFETFLPSFRQVVTELPKHTFGSISLHSSNSPIFAKHLVGGNISIHSRNAPIGGTFNTSSSIDIKTSNAPVKVTVNAFNQDHAPPTEVRIHTSNSILAARLALLSTHEKQTVGAFAVHARTSNSPLALNFTHQTPDSQLKLEAHTSNSPARVHLHPSFEGVFKLQTSIFHAIVSPDADVQDPTGQGRKREVDVKTVRGSRVVHGHVTWVPQGEVVPAGSVDVSTSNSPLHLLL